MDSGQVLEVVPCQLDDGLDKECESKGEPKKFSWLVPGPQNRWDATHQDGRWEELRLGGEQARNQEFSMLGYICLEDHQMEISGR